VFVLQHAKQNLYEKAENETSEQVAKFKCLAEAVTNQIHEKI
jgi:hypothetical protein